MTQARVSRKKVQIMNFFRRFKATEWEVTGAGGRHFVCGILAQNSPTKSPKIETAAEEILFVVQEKTKTGVLSIDLQVVFFIGAE